MIAALCKQPGQGNRSAAPKKTPTVAFDTAFKEFRRIGAESVPELLRAHDPRRAALRLGLLVWPALQPSGNRWAVAVRLVLGLLKPLLWLPVVLAVFAPLLTAFAGSLMWVGVAFSTERWFSPPGHLILACIFAPALVVGFVIRFPTGHAHPFGCSACWDGWPWRCFPPLSSQLFFVWCSTSARLQIRAAFRI
ncbi:hypothetical protein ACRJ4W_35705 [Streptomyces sp. GLT-R25]